MPAVIHCSHRSRIRDLNAQFTEMSNGCSFFVSPPGITAVVIWCFFFKFLRTSSSMWPVKPSKINSDVRLNIDTGLFFQTFSDQTSMPSQSIQSFFWQWTTTSLHSFSLGMVFYLKITIGFSFCPVSEQASTTVKLVFSWPVVVIGTVPAPTASTARDNGASNDIRTSSMLKTLSPSISSSVFLLFTKFVNFSSKSSGSFWQTVVLVQTERQFLRMNRWHQLGPPTKSARFICVDSSFAFNPEIHAVR